MSATISHFLTLETESCYSCAIVFAMPADFKRQKLRDGGNFYCPNGHSQHYTKPEVARLREQLDASQRDLRAAKCEVLNEREARVSAEKKLERVKHGVCPCCKRSFQNLARHMATKHPARKKS